MTNTAIFITHVRFSNETKALTNISHFKYEKTGSIDSGKFEKTKAELIEDMRKNPYWLVVVSLNDEVGPEVNIVEATPPYLRSEANDTGIDNLLSLPKF